MSKKSLPLALALVAVLALVPSASAQVAGDAPAASAEAALPAAGCAGGTDLATEEPDWASTLNEGPIGGLPYPCEGAIFQQVWERDGCCSGPVLTAQARFKQMERFYCPNGTWSAWYWNYKTKCADTCFQQ